MIRDQVLEMSLPSFDLGFSDSLVAFGFNFGVQSIIEPPSTSKMRLPQSQPFGVATRSRAIVPKAPRGQRVQRKKVRVDSKTSALNLWFLV